MKSFIISLVIISYLFLSSASSAQEIRFSYDASGNLISRITIEEELKSVLNDSITSVRQYLNDTNGSQPEEIQISLFPNPTTSNFKIGCNDCPVGISLSMFLFSSNGKLLQRIIYDGNQNTIDMSGYPTGTYILKSRIGKAIKSWKITKY